METEMAIPEALISDNPSHVQAIYQAIESSTKSSLESVRKPAEDLLKTCEDLPGYTSVLVAIAGAHGAAPDARSGAVILLKNVVRGRWKSRGGRGRVVGEGEKNALRLFLLSALEEPDDRVAVQLAVLTAKVARIDWPRQWSELFGSLMTSATQGQGLQRHRSLYSLHQVLKELSTKRVGFDKAAFAIASKELFPAMLQLWDAQWDSVEMLFSTLGAGGGGGALGITAWVGTEAIYLCTLYVKVLYRLMLFGLPGLEHPNVAPFLEALLSRMQALGSALQHLAAVVAVLPGQTSVTAVTVEGGEGASEKKQCGLLVVSLQKLWRRMAVLVVDTQKDHPIAFYRYLGPFLVFFFDQLKNACGKMRQDVHSGVAQHGEADHPTYPYEPFTIQCLNYLSNTIKCTSYQQDLLVKACSGAVKGGGGGSGTGRMITGKGDATITPEVAQDLVNTLSGFFTPDRVVLVLSLVMEGVLPLSNNQLEEWVSDPEQFHLVQDSLGGQESARVSGEQLLMSLFWGEAVDTGDVVAPRVTQMVMEGAEQQVEVCRLLIPTSSSTEGLMRVLLLDALYLCAGLGAYSLKRYLNFTQWFSSCLGPGLEGLVATMQGGAQVGVGVPLVLLRRLLWLVGCWADQIPSHMIPPLVQATATVMQDTAHGTDVAVRLSALEALHALLMLWDLDPVTALGPSLVWLLPALYQLLGDVETFESRQQVLNVMAELLERSGRLLIPHCSAAVGRLPEVWQASCDQTPLRCTCLTVMTHVIDAVGSEKGTDLDEMAVTMISVATNITNDDEVYLVEQGLELWLSVMRNCPEYSGSLHALFPAIPPILNRDLDHLKHVMLILEAYVVIGGKDFLQTHASSVCQCFQKVVGQVKPKGAAFVSRVLESLLRKFPADGSRMLHTAGILGQVMEACRAAQREDAGREPDLVIVMHLSVLCRVLLGSPDTFHSICMQAAQQDNAQGGDRPDQVIGELVGQMSSLFDSAGYNAAGVLRRRLWSVALLTLLPSLNRDVLVHMDQVVNICVDVLTEERNGNGKDLGETLTRIVKGEDDSNGEGEVIQSSHTPLPPLLEARLKQELQGDVAGTMDMRSTVRQSMERLRSTIGDSMWEEVMGSVEPVVLVQLQGMVA